MNMIKFAKLVCNIACRHAINLSDDDIATIAGDIQQIIESEHTLKVNLIPMFSYMLANQKINAIKEHRAITGMGLKESKDEIDRLMAVMKLPEHSLVQP